MPDPKPTPPKGYQIVAKKSPASVAGGKGDDEFIAPGYSDVPAFIKSGIDISKVRQNATPIYGQDVGSIASVSSANPYQVDVDMPDRYGPPTLNHELTHTFQFTRNPALPAPTIPQNATPNDYVYGGVEGLEKAIHSGKTIADFNVEQQADMVRDYKNLYGYLLAKARQGYATPKDLREMYRIRQAYHPFIKQLADMPGVKENIDPSLGLPSGVGPISRAGMLLGLQKTPSLAGAPEAPGLPSYDTPGLGVAPADPLLGGKSAPIPSADGRKIGEKIKFGNGKIGVWDGHGWKAQ